MKFRVHEDFESFSKEDLLERSCMIEKEIRRLLGLKWDLEGVERERIKEQIDKLEIKIMILDAVLSARENRPNNEHRY